MSLQNEVGHDFLQISLFNYLWLTLGKGCGMLPLCFLNGLKSVFFLLDCLPHEARETSLSCHPKHRWREKRRVYVFLTRLVRTSMQKMKPEFELAVPDYTFNTDIHYTAYPPTNSGYFHVIQNAYKMQNSKAFCATIILSFLILALISHMWGWSCFLLSYAAGKLLPDFRINFISELMYLNSLGTLNFYTFLPSS